MLTYRFILKSFLLFPFFQATPCFSTLLEDSIVVDHSVTYAQKDFSFVKDENLGILSTPSKKAKAPCQQSLRFGSNDKERAKSTQPEIILKNINNMDSRSRVLDPEEWPYRVHAQLHVFFADKTEGFGSGVLVGPRHILTAGHNVYSRKDGKKWVNRIAARLALNEGKKPFDEVEAAKIYTFQKWTKGTENESKDFDLALVVLKKPIGEFTGWSGMMAFGSESFKQHFGVDKRTIVHLTGYPGDKNPSSDPNKWQMWTMGYPLKADFNMYDQIFYTIDTTPGQSGSAVWCALKEEPYTIGIHTLGGAEGGFGGNSGVRLTLEKLECILKWISETMEIIKAPPHPPFPSSQGSQPLKRAKLDNKPTQITHPAQSNQFQSYPNIEPTPHASKTIIRPSAKVQLAE